MGLGRVGRDVGVFLPFNLRKELRDVCQISSANKNLMLDERKVKSSCLSFETVSRTRQRHAVVGLPSLCPLLSGSFSLISTLSFITILTGNVLGLFVCDSSFAEMETVVSTGLNASFPCIVKPCRGNEELDDCPAACGWKLGNL